MKRWDETLVAILELEKHQIPKAHKALSTLQEERAPNPVEPLAERWRVSKEQVRLVRDRMVVAVSEGKSF
jgi:hypothetical protein